MPTDDSRWAYLAETVLAHSIRPQPGELVVIDCLDLDDEALLLGLTRGIARRKGRVLVSTGSSRVLRDLIRHASVEQLVTWAEVDRSRLEKASAYVGLRGDSDPCDWAELPPIAWNRYNDLYLGPVHWNLRIPRLRWCMTRLPGPALARLGGMATEELHAQFWDAVTIDHLRLRQAMRPLADRLGVARRVRIVAPGTDLSFDLPGIEPVVCAGERNLPDGEVFTAPSLGSMEGTIRFNTRSCALGMVFEGIELEFEGGRVVGSGCRVGDERKLRGILEGDEGASRPGEWALGCNSRVRRPVGDASMDEKMAGSHHLALGSCYPTAPNGNVSRIHWDLVQVLHPAWGGGRIELDGEVVSEDGRFVDPRLDGLNPET